MKKSKYDWKEKKVTRPDGSVILFRYRYARILDPFKEYNGRRTA